MNEHSDTAKQSTPPTNNGTPRWVRISGIVAGLIVVVFLALQFTGIGGSHGPARHTPGGTDAPTGEHTGPPSGADQG